LAKFVHPYSETRQLNMDQTAEFQTTSSHIVSPEETNIRRHLITLSLAVIFGLIVVWQLRQEWAKDFRWPWLFLLVAMFLAAQALRGLELWLPGRPILPRLAAFPTPQRLLIGSNLITIALILTGVTVWRLWPDYHQWHGTPVLWLAAMVFLVAGAWVIGAVGRGSPRAATALTIWSDSARNRWLEAIAFLLIFALAIFLRTYRLDSIPRASMWMRPTARSMRFTSWKDVTFLRLARAGMGRPMAFSILWPASSSYSAQTG
jgi:hypothetical protein